MQSEDVPANCSNCSRAEVIFGIRGDAVEPDDLTRLLGITPTNAYAKGSSYEVEGVGTYFRPWGIWQLSSADAIDSSEIEIHAEHLLEELEQHCDVISRYVVDDTYYVYVQIWWEACDLGGGFTIPSAMMKRLGVLANAFHFTFIGHEEDLQSSGDANRKNTCPPEEPHPDGRDALKE